MTKTALRLDPYCFPPDPWCLVESRHQPELMGLTETLFSVANSYLGMRANAEEGTNAHFHGTFVNGFHETWRISHPERQYGQPTTGQTIVNAPDTKVIKLYVDDEPLQLYSAELEAYERVLDFRGGVLRRNLIWRTGSGKRVAVTSERMVSLEHRHLAVMRYSVTALDQPSSVTLSSQILNRQDAEYENDASADAARHGADSRRARPFDHRVLIPQSHRHSGTDLMLAYRCANSDMTIAVACRHIIEAPSVVAPQTEGGEDAASTTFKIDLDPGESIELTKLVAYHTSRGVATAELEHRCEGTLDQAEQIGADAVFEQQRNWLDRFWDRSDIAIGCDDGVQQAVRWNLFQLAQNTAAPAGHGVAAKGLSGTGYEGHYFWDTEIFVIPYLIYTRPEIARDLLRFRAKTLPDARRRAAEMDETGALYPWRTINGQEASPYYPASTAQYHINAAVAFAIERYINASGDTGFLLSEAAELLIETARFWVGHGFFDSASEAEFHLHGVTGPDEYTAVVNDNLYTNVMAQFNLRYAAEVIDLIAAEHPDARRDLSDRLALTETEIDEWRRAASAMRLPLDSARGINPQYDGFLELEPWDWQNVPADRYPLLLHFHPLVIYRHQVIKQADVVLAMFLRGDAFSLDQKRRNFDYYDPITTGDSSLSASVQSIVAAEVGYLDIAVDYFRRCLFVDLADTHGNTADGMHMAAAGGVWSAIVHGFAGFRDNGRALKLSPQLPPGWTHIEFPLTWQGTHLIVRIDQAGATVTVKDGPPPPILVGEEVVAIEGGHHRILS